MLADIGPSTGTVDILGIVAAVLFFLAALACLRPITVFANTVMLLVSAGLCVLAIGLIFLS